MPRLHHGRQYRNAACIPGPISGDKEIRLYRPCLNGPKRPTDACCNRQTRLASLHTAAHGADNLCRSLSWLRSKSPAISVSHLAAFRLLGSTHRNHHPVDRRDVEDGPLRISPDSAPNLRPADASSPHPSSMAGSSHGCALCLCGPCPERLEAHLRLLLNQPSRLLPSGDLCRVEVYRRRCGTYSREVCRNERRLPPNVQSRTHRRNTVLVRRHAGEAQWRIAWSG